MEMVGHCPRIRTTAAFEKRPWLSRTDSTCDHGRKIEGDLPKRDGIEIPNPDSFTTTVHNPLTFMRSGPVPMAPETARKRWPSGSSATSSERAKLPQPPVGVHQGPDPEPQHRSCRYAGERLAEENYLLVVHVHQPPTSHSYASL